MKTAKEETQNSSKLKLAIRTKTEKLRNEGVTNQQPTSPGSEAASRLVHGSYELEPAVLTELGSAVHHLTGLELLQVMVPSCS